MHPVLSVAAARVRQNDLGLCPYCDGTLNPELAKVDRFYPKSEYPFLGITPENLVPVCTDCNSLQVKGARAPLELGAANEVVDWFHPYHRTADGQVTVEFKEPRANDQPRRLRLVSSDVSTQRRADNLDALFEITTLWADRLKHHLRARINELRARRRKRGACAPQGLSRLAAMEYLSKVARPDEQVLVQAPGPCRRPG